MLAANDTGPREEGWGKGVSRLPRNQPHGMKQTNAVL